MLREVVLCNLYLSSAGSPKQNIEVLPQNEGNEFPQVWGPSPVTDNGQKWRLLGFTGLSIFSLLLFFFKTSSV